MKNVILLPNELTECAFIVLVIEPSIKSTVYTGLAILLILHMKSLYVSTTKQEKTLANNCLTTSHFYSFDASNHK